MRAAGRQAAGLHFGGAIATLRLKMAFVGRFFDPPGQSYYLFGPRGTGKSAWTQRRYRDGVRIDLLHPATAQRYRARRAGRAIR